MNDPGKIRNIALVGHRGTGKTSLLEGLLYKAGVVNRLGHVGQSPRTPKPGNSSCWPRHVLSRSCRSGCDCTFGAMTRAVEGTSRTSPTGR